MTSHHAMSDMDITLKILSTLIMSKPVSLVTVSQETGIKLADIIRYCTPLVSEKILKRVMDKGNIFYILLTEEYESTLRALYQPDEAPSSDDPISENMTSRKAIMMRRSLRSSAGFEKVSRESQESTPASSTTPERVSALDLLAIKRSSTSLSYVPDASRSSSRRASQTSSTQLQSVHRDYDRSTTSSSGLSSTSHKAVFINSPAPRRNDSRPAFSAPMPPSDAPQMERSDGMFAQRNPSFRRHQEPIIPEFALTTTNNDVPDEEVREALQIPSNIPLIAILSPRPSYEIWASCSALANSGGGYIVLGMRKYVKDGNVTYFIKSVTTPEEAIKNIFRNFNDRNLISDCPKDPSFITTKTLHKKNLIVMHIDPALFGPAPVYTTRDSFGMKTMQGCFMYLDGEIVHCSQDEVKNLWTQKRLEKETPDWNQDAPQLDVEMSKKIHLHLPSPADDDIRPLSRKAPSQPTPASPTLRHSRRTLKSTEPPQIDQIRTPYAPITAQAYQQFFNKITVPAQPFDSSASTQPLREMHCDEDTIPNLLLAEDIRIPSKKHLTPVPMSSQNRPMPAKQHDMLQESHTESDVAQAAVTYPADTSPDPALPPKSASPSPSRVAAIPPLYKDADHDLLHKIALPVLEHPRLPMARVCEISVKLCQNARFTVKDLAEILGKKTTPIRNKVMPVLRQDPRFVEEGKIFYLKTEA